MALFTDAPEMVVVIVGVVELAALAPDDAPCAACALARRLHRVLTIVAAILPGQDLLAVAEDCAVLGVRKRPALADHPVRRPPFARNLRVPHISTAPLPPGPALR